MGVNWFTSGSWMVREQQLSTTMSGLTRARTDVPTTTCHPARHSVLPRASLP